MGQGRLAKSCGRNQNDWKSDNTLHMFMFLVSFMVNTKKGTKIRSKTNKRIHGHKKEMWSLAETSHCLTCVPRPQGNCIG